MLFLLTVIVLLWPSGLPANGTNVDPTTGASPRSAIEPGDSVVEAMFARWNNRAYRTATFVQETRFPDGRKQVWYESLRAPGLRRIDTSAGDSGSTLLFREDSVYAGKSGRWTDARPYVRALQILFTDVFWVPSNATTRQLRALGFDLSVVHTETWQGRATIVVGATQGDVFSPQFWVDKERLIVVRLIENETRPGAGPLDTRVLSHVKAGEGWIESDVIFYEGGREKQHETYSDIRINVPLESAMFSPTGSTAPEWLRAKKKP